jgi:curved DNA-binding protein CbpA
MDTKYNHKEDKMDIQTALHLLDIDDFTRGNYTKVTYDYVKRKYHKMALKCHPDKNGNTKEATQRFQRITNAYNYLITELELKPEFNEYEDKHEDFVSSSSSKDNENDSQLYTSLLSVFLAGILKVDTKTMPDLLVRIVKDIVLNGTKVISTKIIDDLDKDKSLELYNFLNKYKHILYISQDTLEFVSSLIKEKYKNDRVYILNPSIDDLLDNNIYKLYVDEQLYLAPLWHNELYFEDPDKNDIIVLCVPQLPEDITIDENNNIHCNLLVAFEKEMLLNQDKNPNLLNVNIGKHVFNIPFDKLYMKKEQKYVIKGEGISHIFENDIYNQTNHGKGDIIVSISLI